MDVNPPERPLFHHRWSRRILLERQAEQLNNHPYQLKIKDYPLPHSNISYEFATLTSEYRPVECSIFRWFRSAISRCNSQNGRELVSEMTDVFQSQKHELPESLREFVLAEGITDVCYRVQIEDSELMKKVFDVMHENDPTFRLLHNLASLKRSHFAATDGRTTSYTNQPDFLTFYFEHARHLKLKYNGTRFFDLNDGSRRRVFSAANDKSWKLMLRYLQFGARFENVIDAPSFLFCRVQLAMTNTIRCLIRDIWLLMVKPANDLSLTDPKAIEEYCLNLNRGVRDLCRTFKIILRAVKLLRRDVFEFVNLVERSGMGIEIPIQRIIHHSTVQLMIPTLSQRYGYPMQLQHACRCAIRERLNENWQLPAGINHLPIPNKMKRSPERTVCPGHKSSNSGPEHGICKGVLPIGQGGAVHHGAATERTLSTSHKFFKLFKNNFILLA